MNRLGRRIADCVAVGLDSLLGNYAGEKFGILTYHRIAPWKGRAFIPTWNVSPRQFRSQLQGLLFRGFQPWALRKIIEFRRTQQLIPPKTFVVTFDDGFENVYQHAWPILRGLGIPATIFLATQYLDAPEPFPFDDWELAGSMAVAPDSWRPLSTAQCAEMHADGLIDIGSHTHAHEDFRGRPSAFSRDLALSLEVLRARLGLTKVPFAFPSGLTSQELISAAKQAGLLCGLNTQGIPVDHRSDPFTWGRFTSTETDTVGDLAAKLNGWYTFMRSAWRRLKYFPSDGVVADSDPASDTDGVASPRLDLKRSGMDSRECH